MRYEIKGCTRRKRQNSNKWRKSFRIADTGGSGVVRVWHVCVGLVWGSRFAFRMAQTPEESHLHLVTHQNCLSLLINCLHKECIWSCQIVDLPAWFPVGLSFACRLPDLGFCFFFCPGTHRCALHSLASCGDSLTALAVFFSIPLHEHHMLPSLYLTFSFLRCPLLSLTKCSITRACTVQSSVLCSKLCKQRSKIKILNIIVTISPHRAPLRRRSVVKITKL